MATILTIDDDRFVRQVCSRVLTDAGHTVVPYAPVPGETLAACTRLLDEHPIDLVLCDFHFPGMTGLELYAGLAMSERLGGVAFSFMTGAPTDELLAAGLPVLHKPFTIDALEALVREQLSTAVQRADGCAWQCTGIRVPGYQGA